MPHRVNWSHGSFLYGSSWYCKTITYFFMFLTMFFYLPAFVCSEPGLRSPVWRHIRPDCWLPAWPAAEWPEWPWPPGLGHRDPWPSPLPGCDLFVTGYRHGDVYRGYAGVSGDEGPVWDDGEGWVRDDRGGCLLAWQWDQRTCYL